MSDDRYMPSIFTDCDELKQVYDKCFTNFFQKFISPDYRHRHAYNPCERLFEAYKDCVEGVSFVFCHSKFKLNDGNFSVLKNIVHSRLTLRNYAKKF
uniref:COX assembly mitochondrial protein n=1 Tax=Panagrolaimus sp. JU765 TaxID=591449 RepID=A0AC34Q771_9BILA